MGRVKYAVLLGAVALVAAAVPIAQGTSDKTPTARITALEAKVKTLTKAVSALNGCLRYKAAAMVLRGTADNDGYLYQQSTDPTNTYLYTALDAPAQGEKEDFATALVNPACLTPGTKRALAAGGNHRVVLLRFKALPR